MEILDDNMALIGIWKISVVQDRIQHASAWLLHSEFKWQHILFEIDRSMGKFAPVPVYRSEVRLATPFTRLIHLHPNYAVIK